MGISLLAAEDDEMQRNVLALALGKRLGYQATIVNNGQEAINAVINSDVETYSAVLLDICMPVMDGFEALKHIRHYRPDLPVIMLTANSDTNTAVKAIKNGAYDFLPKPLDLEHLALVLKNAIHTHTLTQEVSRLRRDKEGAFRFHDLIGYDDGLAPAVNYGRKAALSDVPVLISGETGVGKEQFARAIHGESRRLGAPFIAVNCGAIPENLVESILFGHEKGAFTGAVARTVGKFREAEGGTLLLDEVGELPLEAQVKLLRAVQQQEVEPVGAAQPVKVNVRIISATHRDLKQDVRAGRFREDLYFRLNVLPIALLPLRERQNDILPLAEYFLQCLAAAEMHIPKTLAPDACTYLMHYPWPGNVRELENLMHRAFVLCDGETIRQEQLQELHAMDGELHDYGTLESSPSTAPFITLRQPDGSYKTIHDIEAEAMETVLHLHGGNITRAAEALKMAKSTFYRKMQEPNKHNTVKV